MVYAKYLNQQKIKKTLEIGLGFNNTEIMSNMSKLGNPGASLFAFRDFLPQSEIWGADIDENTFSRQKWQHSYEWILKLDSGL